MDEAVSGGTSVYKWIVHAETKRIRRTLRLLPPPVRAKVQSALTLGLIGEPFHVETPRGRLAFTLLGLSTAQRAIATLTKQPDTNPPTRAVPSPSSPARMTLALVLVLPATPASAPPRRV